MSVTDPSVSSTTRLPKAPQTATDTRGNRRFDLPAYRVLAGLFILWIILASFPVPPFGLGSGLDASWGYALNMAHAQHLVFGKDFIFTFGPLGYLTCPDPDLADRFTTLAFRLAAYLLFGWGI